MRGNCIRGMVMEIYLLLGCPFIRFDFRIWTFRPFLSFRCLIWGLFYSGRSCIIQFRYPNRSRLTLTTRAETVRERISFWGHDHFFRLWRRLIWLALPEAVWAWRHLGSCILPVTRRSSSAMCYRILCTRVVWASGRQWPLLWTSFHNYSIFVCIF